jgi:glutamate-5-semialdehyde dehydrogenase
MAAPLKTVESAGELAATMDGMGRRARAAARVLAQATAAEKNNALAAMAKALRTGTNQILAANADDIADAKKSEMTPAFIDRLTLNAERIEAMAAGIETVAALADPVGVMTESWTRPNGMTIERVRVPLGVIGII